MTPSSFPFWRHRRGEEDLLGGFQDNRFGLPVQDPQRLVDAGPVCEAHGLAEVGV